MPYLAVSADVRDRLRELPREVRRRLLKGITANLNLTSEASLSVPGLDGYFEQTILEYTITYRHLRPYELRDPARTGYFVAKITPLGERIREALMKSTLF